MKKTHEEETLNLRRSLLKRKEAKKRVKTVKNFIKIRISNASHRQIQELNAKVNAREISRIVGSVYNGVNFKNTDIKAVRLHYAANTNKEFFIIYEFVILENKKSLSSGNNNHYLYEEKKINTHPVTATYYVINNDGLFIEFTGPVAKSKENYRNVIEINRKTAQEPLFTDFIEEVDSESALFPIQEIFNIFKESDDPDSAYLYIYNAVIRNMHDSYVESRHSIVLSTMEMPRPFWKREGAYADLAHLCPPHCKIIYQVIPKVVPKDFWLAGS